MTPYEFIRCHFAGHEMGNLLVKKLSICNRSFATDAKPLIPLKDKTMSTHCVYLVLTPFFRLNVASYTTLELTLF